MIKFIVPGRPVPAPRMTQRSKWDEKFARYHIYKRDVGWFAKWATPEPIEGYIYAKIIAYIYGKRRMDIDNVAKTITDACNGICYKDDSLIWELNVKRVPAPKPELERVEVEFYPLASLFEDVG